MRTTLKFFVIVAVGFVPRPAFAADLKPRPPVPGFGAPAPEKGKGDKDKIPGFGPAGVSAIDLEKRYDRRVIEYVDRMLRDYDKNEDGVIDGEEGKAVKWSNDPKESDADGDGKLTKAELCERIAKRWSRESAYRSSRDGNSSGSSSGGSASQANSEEYQKVRRYAEGLLKQYDTNQNGVLEKDEWSQMKSSTREADTNGDGVITLDELTTKLGSFGKSDSSSGSSTSSSSNSPSTSSSSSSNNSSSRDYRSGSSNYGSKPKTGTAKTGRFLSPTERLPKGLPDWFVRNDADGDGQIMMAEFSTAWTDAKAEEFFKYDLNGDGFITPTECLTAEKKPK